MLRAAHYELMVPTLPCLKLNAARIYLLLTWTCQFAFIQNKDRNKGKKFQEPVEQKISDIPLNINICLRWRTVILLGTSNGAKLPNEIPLWVSSLCCCKARHSAETLTDSSKIWLKNHTHNVRTMLTVLLVQFPVPWLVS